MFGRSLSEYLVIIPAVLIAIMVHEVCHGYTAYLLGDNTAKNAGRLNFNPVSHLDPIGLLCMIFVGFGWAKPVPINLANLKNRKWGMVLVALAGPMSNFILTFFSLLLAVILSSKFGSAAVVASLVGFLITLVNLSLGLGIFNLIPVPPLDGSNIIFPFLSGKMRAWFYNNGQYIQFGLLALLMFGFLDNILITVRAFMLNGMLQGVSAIVSLFM